MWGGMGMAAWSKISKSSLSLRVAGVELWISMPSLDLVIIVAKVGGWWLACSLDPWGYFVADWRPISVFPHDLGMIWHHSRCQWKHYFYLEGGGSFAGFPTMHVVLFLPSGHVPGETKDDNGGVLVMTVEKRMTDNLIAFPIFAPAYSVLNINIVL